MTTSRLLLATRAGNFGQGGISVTGEVDSPLKLPSVPVYFNQVPFAASQVFRRSDSSRALEEAPRSGR